MLPIKRKHVVLSFINITTLTTHKFNHGLVYFASTFQRRDHTVNPQVAKSNRLITELCKTGRLVDARKTFDEMPDRDVITWTAVISGFVRHGMVDEARKLFDRDDAMKDVITWTVMLNGYSRLRRIEEAEKLFATMPERNVVTWNTMIEGYAKSGRVDSALELFRRMPERNVVSWNTMVTALAQQGMMGKAWSLFESMPERNVVSWTAILAGLARNGKVDEAGVVFERMPVRNVVSWNAMVAGYVRVGRVEEAFELFERMPERNTCSWNTMVSGFAHKGEISKALLLFKEMPRKDSVSWTAVITGYVKGGQSEEALKVFSRMAADGVRPNEATFASTLSACSNLAGLVEGQQIHQMINKTFYRDSEILVSALINMYSKCGELSSARKIFDDGSTNSRDLISWNGMISAYAHHGCGVEAIVLFNELRKLGFKPDDVTYVGLLSACSHAGLVEEGLLYFNELINDTSIRVRDEHYTCYVDLCGRAGNLKHAFDFIERIGTKPSPTVWEALIAACNVHNDTHIASVATQKLMEYGPERAGTYSLLSNVYASSGKWKEAAKLRLEMKEKGLKKQPGCSWIEVGNAVHVFVVGDKSDCQFEILYSLLCVLHEKMKRVRVVPNSEISLDEFV